MTYRAFGIQRLLRGGLIAATLAVAAGAADFNLAATIQAGAVDLSGYELGLGPIANPAAFTGQVNGAQYFQNGVPRNFVVGYTNSTNTAYLRYYYGAGPAQFRQVNYSPGGAGIGGNSTWTIPTGSLSVMALPLMGPSSVTISSLALGGGLTVLQPFTTLSMSAAQNMSFGWQFSTAPVRFRTGASGDWLLSGNITFTGLATASNPGGAIGDQLRMRASIQGTTIPEPATAALIGAALAALGCLKLRRGKGPRQGEA